jgi:hypothetical protein
MWEISGTVRHLIITAKIQVNTLSIGEQKSRNEKLWTQKEKIRFVLIKNYQISS